MPSMTSLRASFERAKENLRARASSRSSSKPAENPPTNGTTLKVKGYVEVKRLGKGSFGHAKLVMREDTREPFCAKFVNYKGMRPAEKEYVAREVRTYGTGNTVRDGLAKNPHWRSCESPPASVSWRGPKMG